VSNNRRPEGALFNNKNPLGKNIMGFIEYIKDTKGEMKHVSWPTKKQAVSYTLLVILISVLVAFFLGLADFSFSKLLGSIINS
jgi:preprotein translocase subunit SecE